MRFGLLAILATITLGGCTLPMAIEEEEVCEEDPCVLVMELDVVRINGNTYWTNELDIWDNKLAFDCRRVKIYEKWEPVGTTLLLFTHEIWKCYDCPDTPDIFNAQAAVYVNEWF